MRLIFFRHGIAHNREAPDCPPDFERRLTTKGIRRTTLAAAGLRELGVCPDLILTSPLVRAVETAEIAADELGIDAAQIRQTASLAPEADPQMALDEAAVTGARSIMLVGHAPNLDLVLGSALGLRFAAITSLKKAGAACVEMMTDSAGSLVWLYEPKTLRRLVPQDQ